MLSLRTTVSEIDGTASKNCCVVLKLQFDDYYTLIGSESMALLGSYEVWFDELIYEDAGKYLWSSNLLVN